LSSFKSWIPVELILWSLACSDSFFSCNILVMNYKIQWNFNKWVFLLRFLLHLYQTYCEFQSEAPLLTLLFRVILLFHLESTMCHPTVQLLWLFLAHSKEPEFIVLLQCWMHLVLQETIFTGQIKAVIHLVEQLKTCRDQVIH
jgi:hypothetical protein